MSFYTIKEAIRDGACLNLALADGEHIVEPYLLGRNARGDTLLRAYEVRGPRGVSAASRWKLIRLECIDRAVETGRRFTRSRPGYKPNDRTMTGGIIERV